MRRRLTGFLLMTAIFGGTVLQTQASERLGTIYVEMDHGNASAQGAEMTLYYAGSPSEDGYRLADSFGGGFVRQEDVHSPELARWLSEAAVWEGERKYLEEDGSAVFSQLPEGVYLLTQSKSAKGFRQASPCLIPIPCNGMWEITALPKMQQIYTESPKTGQHPAPILGAMGLVLSGMGLVACWDKFRKNR